MSPTRRPNEHPLGPLTRHRVSSRMLRILFLGALLFGGVSVASAQTGSIRGTAVDANTREPLAGVQVYVPTTTLGTLTNASGAFLLPNVPVGEVAVTAQLIGYGAARREVTVTEGEATTLTLELSQSAIALDEIVVTGAGQATQKKKLGNTVATINTDKLLETAPVANVSEVLMGREPGVAALPTGGVAGEGTKIRIRGTSSLSQVNEPIIYVDGVRVDNRGGMGGLDQGGGSPSRLDDINPASIERIEILKGAAAATLYGTEASNGVIQIFTKKGTAGAARWNLKMEQGISNYPEDRYKPHAGFARTPEEAARLSEFWNQNIQPFQVFEEDLFPRLFENGRSSEYSLSVNGGDDAVTYFVSGRLLNENGPFTASGFGAAAPGIDQVEDVNAKRQANANISFRPTDNLRFTATSAYVDGHLEVPDNNNNIYGTISTLVNSKPERANENNPTGSVPTFGSIREMFNRLTEQDVRRFSGSFGASFIPMQSVNFEATMGVDLVTEENIRFVPFGWSVDGLSGATPDGTRTVRDRNQRQLTFDTKASWNQDLSPVFNSAFVLGAQGFFTKNRYAGSTGAKFPGQGLEVTEAGADQSAYEFFVSEVSAGVFAQEQIGFNDYLFFTVGGRYDKHSAFGESAGGAFYPKVSVSFVPSDLPAWNSNLFSSVRVRAAVGRSGLQPSAFDKFTTFAPIASQVGSGVAPQNLGNPDLEPEVSTEYEGGFDIGLFNDRAALTATYWDRTVTNALVPRQFAPSGGFRASQLDNIGELKAQGVELSLSGVVVSTPSYSLDLFVNGSYIREEISSLGGAPPIKPGYYRYGNWYKEGYAPGAFFGPQLVDARYPFDQNQDGQLDSEAELLAYFSEPRAPEDLLLVLADDDGDGDLLDYYLGKPTPDWQGSFGGELTFLRNFRLSTLFEYKAGNYYTHNLTDAFRRSHSLIGRNIREASEQEAILVNPASTPQQRLEAARVFGTEDLQLAPYSRLNAIEPSDLVRWRELSLTYNVPNSVLGRFGANSLAITVAGRNIALFTEYSGVDPEINVTGGRDPTNSNEFNNAVQGVEGWGFALPRRLTISAAIGF